MWRSEEWKRYSELRHDCSISENEAYEAGADAMQGDLIKWIKTHKLTEYWPGEGDSFDAYIIPSREIPSVET